MKSPELGGTEPLKQVVSAFRPGPYLFPPVVERMKVDRGFEAALGAALGDDLDQPDDRSAPAHWRLAEASAALAEACAAGRGAGGYDETMEFVTGEGE